MSFTQSLISAVALATLANSRTVKFGVLTDIHLNPEYQPHLDVGRTFCGPGPQAQVSEHVANFGRPGCDSPKLLVETMMKQMKAEHPDLEVILVPGDIVTHAFPSDKPENNQTVADSYQNILGVLDEVSDLFETHFGSVIVLPTIGNNDTQYHYNPAEGANKESYYDRLISDWFTGHTGN